MSEHSNNLIISKLALPQVFYALHWPVNAKKIALYVSFFKLCYKNYTIFYCEPEAELYKPILKYFLLDEPKPERFNLSEP